MQLSVRLLHFMYAHVHSMYTACTSVCTATPAVSVIPSTSDTSNSVIALSVLIGILCGLLTVSVVINIYCFIRYSKFTYLV